MSDAKVDLKATGLAVLAVLLMIGCSGIVLLAPTGRRQPILLVAALAIAWGLTRLERTRFRDLGWARFRLFFAGIGIVVGIQALLWAAIWIPARVRLNPGVDLRAAVSFLLFVSQYHVVVAVWEELLNRGIITRLLCRGLGMLPGGILGAVIFAVPHLLGPYSRHAGLAGVITDVLGGCLYLALYAGSGSLWLPIGAHFAWNVAANMVTLLFAAQRRLPIDPVVLLLMLAVMLAAWWAERRSPWLGRGGDQAA